MRKLAVFKITILNNPQAVYHAGDLIEGHVTVDLKAPMKMRGIYIKFQGKAYVHWTERHTTGSGNNRKTETRHYSASEVYFDDKVPCYGKPNPGVRGDNPELEAGHHVFPFRYQLPENLPSSFEGRWGHVRYSMKANIDKPWKFDHETKKLFTVICLLDLNNVPNAAQPIGDTHSTTLCCLCCESGPITADVSLDKRGYVPGESIVINAKVYNGSNRQMDCSRVKLTMFSTFHATTKSRIFDRQVTAKVMPVIEAGETVYWRDKQILVPPVPPSYLLHCRIIDVSYTLQFEVDPSGPSFDLEIPFKIIIGTIPLHQVAATDGVTVQPQSFGSPFPPKGKPQALDTPLLPAAPANLYPPIQSTPASSVPKLPPPSYYECVFGKVLTHEDDDTEQTMGDNEFTPVYTFYDWEQHLEASGNDKTEYPKNERNL